MMDDVFQSNLIPDMTPLDEAIPDEVGAQRVNTPLGPAVCRFRVTVFYVIAASPVNARVCNVYITVIHVALHVAAFFIRTRRVRRIPCSTCKASWQIVRDRLRKRKHAMADSLSLQRRYVDQT